MDMSVSLYYNRIAYVYNHACRLGRAAFNVSQATVVRVLL